MLRWSILRKNQRPKWKILNLSALCNSSYMASAIDLFFTIVTGDNHSSKSNCCFILPCDRVPAPFVFYSRLRCVSCEFMTSRRSIHTANSISYSNRTTTIFLLGKTMHAWLSRRWHTRATSRGGQCITITGCLHRQTVSGGGIYLRRRRCWATVCDNAVKYASSRRAVAFVVHHLLPWQQRLLCSVAEFMSGPCSIC